MEAHAPRRGRRPISDQCPAARGCRAPNRRLERAPSPADALAVRPDGRRGVDRPKLVSAGSVSDLLHHAGVDLRALDRHPDAAVTTLILALSFRSCCPSAPFAELVRLSPMSIADEMREEHTRQFLGELARREAATGNVRVRYRVRSCRASQ
jgi:hypothetical protein